MQSQAKEVKDVRVCVGGKKGVMSGFQNVYEKQTAKKNEEIFKTYSYRY